MRPTERLLESSLQARGFRGPSSRGEYSICCPFCRKIAGVEDSKFKLQYNPTKSVYHCYKCGTSGRAELPSLSNGAVPVVDTPKPVSLGPPKGFLSFEQGSSLAEPYINYMGKRGFSLNRLRGAGAGFCATGRYAGRVVFPVFKTEFALRRVVAHGWSGFSARAIYDGMEPKYLYPSGMNRRELLWGDDGKFRETRYIVEGVLDGLALWPFALAAFGKNVSDGQIEIIRYYRSIGSRIVVCLDGDAWEECMVLATRLNLHGIGASWCKLPPKTDPGMLGFDVFNYLVTS